MRIIGYVCIFLWFAPVKSQSSHTLLFRISPEMGIQQFTRNLPANLGQVQCVDQDFGLYAIKLNPQCAFATGLEILNRNRGCLFAQVSHDVQRRYRPSDPLVSSQLHLGIIRAYEAWDHGRGRGVSGRGDTLVIAEFDDGVDTLHPDLAANIWKNRREIPWNGIDEDSNGYMDDYFGWNGGDSNCRVVTSQSIGQGHGTSVAGVMGAVAENNTGIAGTAYRAKIMPLLCYSTIGTDGEISVVRSMLYAWRQKKLYLSSGGKKGANIIAANFSLGIDRTFANEAPLWCAMYDSLGHAGILSVGATTDADNDVDAVGDIPTSCPSPYLIMVSYTDNNDIRMTSGFSATQVDMAAPGNNIFTTLQRRDAGANPPYHTEGGTSFAAPMVTGTVAFLYNNVCDSFLRLQETNNDSAQRLMKSWILSGTDPASSLAGKCLTGGRLNMLRSWQLMDQWCKSRDIKYSLEPVPYRNLRFYPNPVASGQKITLTDIPAGNYTCSISGIGGNLLFSGNLQAVSETAYIQPGNLPAGLYFLTVKNESRQLVGKLQVY